MFSSVLVGGFVRDSSQIDKTQQKHTSSLRSRRIKWRGWGRRKRIRGKKFPSSNALPLSPSSPLYTPATQATHLQFCKRHLEVRNKASSVACRAELDRFPLNIAINRKQKHITYLGDMLLSENHELLPVPSIK